MKIKSVFVEKFGKLKNMRLSFDDGITVINGSNESGKSSLSRFIRFMLFGFTSVRASGISENDKKKHMPWDDSYCKGEMTVSSEDKAYTVRREQATRASFSILDEDGVPAFSGINAGEAFLGIDADTYDKTAFIGAGDVFFDNAVSLSGAIKNMVFSADSSVDSEDALKKLENYKKSILGKTERSGRLYEARKEMSELLSRQTELREIHKDLIGAQNSLDRIKAKISENTVLLDKRKEEKDNIEAHKAKVLDEKITAAKEKADKCRKDYEEKGLEMSCSGNIPERSDLYELNEAILNLLSASSAWERAKEELEKAKQGVKTSYSNMTQLNFNMRLDKTGKSAKSVLSDIELLKKRKKQFFVAAVVFTALIITLPIALFFYLKTSKINKELEKLASIFGCTELYELEELLENYDMSSAAAADSKKKCEAAEKMLEKAETIRGEYAFKLCKLIEKTGGQAGISDNSELEKNARLHIKKLDSDITELETKKAELDRSEASLEGLVLSAGDLDALKDKAEKYNPEMPLGDEAKINMEIDFYTRAIEGLAVQEREYEKKTAVIAGNMEKPDEIAAKIAMLTKEIEELETKNGALEMAIQAIESSHESIRGNVSPILTRNASELFKKMTGGKYEGLYVASNLELSFLESGSAEYRSVEYLSSGALDAAYLCLRITLAEYLYKEPPVLVFDDAFSRFDDERLENAMRLLETLSQKYQIFVLSCHSREAQMLKKAKNIKI